MNSTIKPKPCKDCGSIFHTATYHKPRKPIVSKPKPPKGVVKKVTRKKAKERAWKYREVYVSIYICLVKNTMKKIKKRLKLRT